jgi:hypothetical protein
MAHPTGSSPSHFAIPNGAINNLNGFGTVSGARDRQIMQLAMAFVFWSQISSNSMVDRSEEYKRKDTQ